MNNDLMETITGTLIEGYNLYARTGYPTNIPIPKREAAQQIAKDIKDQNLVLHFISKLIDVHYSGIMGRTYPVKYLKQLVQELQVMGFIYDNENSMFVENPAIKTTRNWGVLRNNEEYLLSFLRFDIVGNSRLVREYPEKTIKSTYADLGKIIKKSILSRNGRIWNWEGDGGMIAFYFSTKNLLATLSAMEILHKIFIYNQMECRLKSPLLVRISVHSGHCTYSKNDEDIKKSDAIKKLIDVEANYTEPDSVTISDTVFASLDENLASQFTDVKTKGKTVYHNYKLRWEV